VRLLDRIAGAPITWGVCEVPGWGQQLPPERVLAEMSALGLRATELGPDGYLPGEPQRTVELLDRYQIAAVGGFVPLVLHRSEEVFDALAQARHAADLISSRGGEIFVLAADTGAGGYEQGAELTDDEWETLVDTTEGVTEIAGRRNLTVAFHPHHGTAIETPEAIKRLIEASSVPICVDTGHIVIGGGDPLEITAAAGDRVAHVHLKDVNRKLADRVRAGTLPYHEAVVAGLYRPLGCGDVDLAAIVQLLEAKDYQGWYVLEQDCALDRTPPASAGPISDARTSIEWLRHHPSSTTNGRAGTSGKDRSQEEGS
jgi:inosose dehydratase